MKTVTRKLRQVYMKTRVYFWLGVIVVLVVFSAHVFGSSPSITQGPWLSSVTRSTAVLSWVTDQACTSATRWGLTPGAHPYTSTGSGNSLVHSWYIAGAPGNSTIYYVVCSSNGVDPETCSSESSFTTSRS